MRTTRRILEELAAQRADSREYFERLDRRFDERAEEFDEERRQNQEERHLNREILRRNEIVMRDMTTALAELREQSRQTYEATEAHTRAIFALIDFLRGTGPQPAV